MNYIEKKGLLFCFIIYIILMLPSLISINIKNKDNNIKKYNNIIAINIIINTILAITFFSNVRNIFNLFNGTEGEINFSIYSAKILFIFSPIISLKLLLPIFLYKKSKNKNYLLIILAKIIITLAIAKIALEFLNLKQFLFVFPITDLIYLSLIITNYILNISIKKEPLC